MESETNLYGFNPIYIVFSKYLPFVGFLYETINGKNFPFSINGLVLGFSIITIQKNTDVFLRNFPVCVDH